MSIGRINAYECPDCGLSLVTIDRAEGVTPMFRKCPTCGLKSDSCMYDESVQILTPTHEWYKPTDEELVARYATTPHLDAMRRHVANGGLDIRKIDAPPVPGGQHE